MSWSEKTITDQGFASRFNVEYRNVAAWTAPHVDLGESQILDFGCGGGIAALRMALEHPAATVHGIDIEAGLKNLPRVAEKQLGLTALPANLKLEQSADSTLPFARHSFDMIYSWSVFEHVSWKFMDQVIAELVRILRPGGILFLQIDPLYYSARGAHLYTLLDQPWVHLRHQHDLLKEMLFSATREFPGTSPAQAEAQLERHRNQLWRQYRSLNRITADQLIETFGGQGFELVREHRTRNPPEPPASLLRVYSEEVLVTSQVQAMFKAIA